MLVIGCKRYGQDTGNPACTYNELQYAKCTGKKIILLRMIPAEEEFDHVAARGIFNMGDEHECFEWLPGTPMAPELPERIAAAMGIEPGTNLDTLKIDMDKTESGTGIPMSDLSQASSLHLPETSC